MEGLVMSEDEDPKKNKGIDIAKIVAAQDRHLRAARSVSAHMEKLHPALSTITKIQENAGLSALTRSVDTTGIGAMQRTIDNSSIGALAKSLQGLNFGAKSAFSELTKGLDFGHLTAASRLAIDVDAFGGTAFAKLARSIDSNLFPSTLRTIQIPGLKNMLGAIDTGSFGAAIAQANRNYALGLPKTFGSELQATVGGLNQQMRALGNIGIAQRRVFEGLQFSNLEGLLAKSLEVQEALLEEQQKVAEDAKASAKFQTRLNVIMAVITIIMFMITLVNTFEDWTTDDDIALEANTAAIEGMQDALATMAAEMEELRGSQAEEAQRESESDNEIAGILRGIAGALETEGGKTTSP